MVHHVDILTPVRIADVTTYFTNNSGLWPVGAIGATLNIIEQTTGLPDPNWDPSPTANGISVNAEMANFGNLLSVTASDLDITLGAGEYWFGLTPNIDFALFGQEFHAGSDFFLKNTAARNPRWWIWRWN